jgi:hypothetical protein
MLLDDDRLFDLYQDDEIAFFIRQVLDAVRQAGPCQCLFMVAFLCWLVSLFTAHLDLAAPSLKAVIAAFLTHGPLALIVPALAARLGAK